MTIVAIWQYFSCDRYKLVREKRVVIMDFFCFDDAVRHVNSAPDNEVDIIILPPPVDSQSDNDEQFSGLLPNDSW